MSPRVFVYPYWVVFWILFITVFLVIESRILRSLRRQMAAADRSQDAGSLQVLVAANQLGVLTAIAIALYAPRFAIGQGDLAFWVGAAMLAAGGALRVHCFRMLGASFSGVVRVHPGQAVLDRGAYRWVRHPSYTAAFLAFAGVGLCLTNWLSLGLIVTVSAAAYVYRASVEERALVRVLGDAYRSYQSRTRRFIPFVY